MSVEESRSSLDDEEQDGSLRDEIASIRETSRKRQVLLVSTLAAVGLSALGSVSVVGYLASQVGVQLREFERRIEATQEDRVATERELLSELSEHRKELESLQRASEQEQGEVQRSREELRQTYTKLSSALSDQQERLEQMRAHNFELQEELGRLERQLSTARSETGRSDADDTRPLPTRLTRFKLGSTTYEHETEQAGFIAGSEPVRRATSAHIPGHVLIEVLPVGDERLHLGSAFYLRVHLVNRSHRMLRVEALELSWRMGGKRIGGPLNIPTKEVEPRSTALVYEIDGEWSPLQDRGNATVEATLVLAEGESLSNTLAW